MQKRRCFRAPIGAGRVHALDATRSLETVSATRGMSGKGRVVWVCRDPRPPRALTLCVQLSEIIAQIGRNINSWPPGGWGESTALLREAGYQTWECKSRGKVRGDKSPGSRPERSRRGGDWLYWGLWLKRDPTKPIRLPGSLPAARLMRRAQQ